MTVAATGYFPFHQNCLIWSSRFEAFNIQFSFHLLCFIYLSVLVVFKGMCFKDTFYSRTFSWIVIPKLRVEKETEREKGGKRATWLWLQGTKEEIYSI